MARISANKTPRNAEQKVSLMFLKDEAHPWTRERVSLARRGENRGTLTRKQMATDQQVLEEYQRTGSKRKAASNLGMPWTTFRGALKRALIRVEGITPSHTTLDPAELLAKLINRQDRKDASIELSRNQRITVKDDKPIVIALLSDTHWGNNKTDYRALKRDTDLIAGCPTATASRPATTAKIGSGSSVGSRENSRLPKTMKRRSFGGGSTSFLIRS